MRRDEDRITKTWLNKTVVGIVILLLITSLISWASGVSLDIDSTQTDITRMETELVEHKKQAVLDRTEMREAFTRLEKKLDRLIEHR